MAIQAADLFQYEPGQTLDFSGISPAAIFNRSTLPRFQSLMGAGGYAEEDLSPEQRRTSPGPSAESLFAQDSDGPEIIPTPQARPQQTTIPVVDEEEDYSQPLPPAPKPAVAPGTYGDAADFTFEAEAQRDKAGNLSIYEPPSGDGGGAYEIAGITAKYQAAEAANLRDLIERGNYAEAEAFAKDFFRKRAEPFTSRTSNPGIQLQLTDTVHHRGEGGLRRVLQRATGSDSKDYGELIQGLEGLPDPLDAFNSARQDYEWEEVDRGRESRKKFRKGLRNRFNKADAAARSFLTQS